MEMRAAVAQGHSNSRPQKAPSQRSMNKSRPIWKQVGCADFRHYLSTCKFLPECDRNFMARAHALQIEDEIDPLVQEYNDLDLDSDIVNSSAPNVHPPCDASCGHWPVPIRWFVLQTPSHPGYTWFGKPQGT